MLKSNGLTFAASWSPLSKARLFLRTTEWISAGKPAPATATRHGSASTAATGHVPVIMGCSFISFRPGNDSRSLLTWNTARDCFNQSLPNISGAIRPCTTTMSTTADAPFSSSTTRALPAPLVARCVSPAPTSSLFVDAFHSNPSCLAAISEASVTPDPVSGTAQTDAPIRPDKCATQPVTDTVDSFFEMAKINDESVTGPVCALQPLGVVLAATPC